MTTPSIEPLNILIVGGGGREHALAWRCLNEGHRVVAAPGSAGMAGDGVEIADVSVSDAEGIVDLALRERIGLAIVGPEQPLVEGLADRLRDAGVPTLGPGAAAAELEGSKAAAKAFMQRHGIPTARYVTVASLDDGLAALEGFDTPPVIKASGLAAGKGVTVPDTMDEARAALEACLSDHRFGSAGATVVIEERMHGEEASFFAICDGARAVALAPAQDHKRIFDGDQGPNTGGMGAYAPAPVCTAAICEAVTREVVEPTLAGLAEEERPFVGVLFVGLMVGGDGRARVVEYNVRFGDPEVQPLLFGLEGELTPVLHAAARGALDELGPDQTRLEARPAVTVVMASGGYPASSTKGVAIEGIERAAARTDVKVFHAGTRRDEDGTWRTNGGRVLGVCARGDSLETAIARAYEAVGDIRFDGAQVRSDIGARARARTP